MGEEGWARQDEEQERSRWVNRAGPSVAGYSKRDTLLTFVGFFQGMPAPIESGRGLAQ